MDSTNLRSSTKLGCENVFLFMVNQSMLYLWNDFLMATLVFLLVSGTLGLLTLAIMKEFYVTYRSSLNIVYATEEADDAHEFVTNLPSDMKLKLVREALNYPVYGNNLLLLLGLYCSTYFTIGF
ncbi:LOW QUALITY PROTEIN: hypothetical protein V1477_021131 [Vespula maculifrons]|uniref:Copper transporter n=1 Tax=Vespula maculifrons TaxID=7453 RepID=A0ABD2AH82_VESMC